MDDDQQFCLRWNNHQSTLISVFDTLLEKGIHVDCTLAAEGQTLKAHKVVLSACSPYFENVLSQQYDKHPIIILKDVKYAELRAMMDYMYRGEVNISQDQLAALLKAAESLQIKGLSDNKPARPQGHTPRQPSPVNKVSEDSIGSREGSTSPSRRRKKARRTSLEALPVPVPGAITVANPIVPVPVPLTEELPATDLAPAELKVEEGAQGEGEGVEDLTMEEENDESLPSHNDVVRNFQWHMERSQDEMMNADGARDSQGTGRGINVDRPIIKHKPIIPQNASTFAVLRNVILPNEEVMSPKFEEMTEEKEILKMPELPIEKSIQTALTKADPMEVAVSQAVMEFSEEKVKSRGKNPVKKVKDVDDKPKIKKKPVEWEVITKTGDKITETTSKRKYNVKGARMKKRDTVSMPATRKKEDVRPTTRKTQGDDKKKSVYDFDSLSDCDYPLPCEEFKTEKGYQCPNCFKCYNARKNLVRHVTVECGRDPQYECPYCPYRKHRRNEVKKHIQNKHPNEPERLIKRKP